MRATLIGVGLAGALPATAGVGEPDPQFGEAGQVRVVDNLGTHLLEQSDGKIVLIGHVPEDVIRQVVISRYLANGRIDEPFGVHGRLSFVPYAGGGRTTVSAVAQQADGKLLLAGTYNRDGLRSFIARTDRDGVLDLGFGSGGVTGSCTAGTEPFYSSVVARGDRDILATISDWTNDRVDHFAFDGSPLGGFYRADFAPHRAVLQRDGRLIVSGYERSLKRQGLVRLDQNGNPDLTFGEGGFVALDDGYFDNIAVEPATDRIVSCGGAIVRFTADGRPDVTFGAQGTGRVSFGSNFVPSFDRCQAILTMWDGSIAYIGTRSGETMPGGPGVYVAGLDSHGLADLRFGTGSGATPLNVGVIRQSSMNYYGEPSTALVRTRDGDALLVAETTNDVRLVRIDLNAGIDTGQVSVGSGGGTPGTTCNSGGGSGSGSAGVRVASGGSASGGSASAGSGGGGALAWIDLFLLLTASVAVDLARRRQARL